MGGVTKRVGNRGQFFDLLKRLVVQWYAAKKDRKNAPISHCQRRIIHNPTASWQ
jgi:hypothetical protein